MENLSPMMQQYFSIKERHADHILFFRLGDFYEMFFDDALLVSKELELTLTGRDCGQEERAPMCGVPHHSAEAYIARLIKKGFKVAICEQTEDPRAAKGIVQREVVRVVTPGTLVETSMLDEGMHNFIASLYLSGAAYGLAIADISTGEVHVTQFDDADDEKIKNELTRFSPNEIVFNEGFLSKTHLAAFIKERIECCAECLTDDAYDKLDCVKRVREHFKDAAPEHIFSGENSLMVYAIGGLLHYLGQTQMTGLGRLVTLNVYSGNQFLLLDSTARRNLELTETMRTGEKRGSLLWVIDKTKTAMGKRLMRLYLEQPLVSAALIEKRLNAVEELHKNVILRGDIRETLAYVFDLERLLTKIVFGNCTPRDLKSLEFTLTQLPDLRRLLEPAQAALLKEIYTELDPLEDICALISSAVVDEPPASIKDGGVIAPGFDSELDEIRDILTHSRDYIARIELTEKEATGIKNLKIGYNKVFGYYLEVTRSYQSLVPDHYIRKQTLANCERYITEELKELEEKILSASERMLTIENKLFSQLRERITLELVRIQATAGAIARLDVFASLAQVAMDNHYCRPSIYQNDEIKITEGRHPVVEQLLGGAPFVSNDVHLGGGQRQIAIITGPNMAGKSTYMRQTALIVILAQMGSFVPASHADIGIVDGIFTRVGASDDLASGRSTFMVEMSEVAYILKNATARSLLILDEIGRGTSTFDGMSIARAVIEYIADPKKLGAKTMFATHYHELTDLEDELPAVKNYNVAVKKRGEEITFLRKIVPGGADDSYGIEVSKLAGIPDSIIKRSFEILQSLESSELIPSAPKRIKAPAARESDQLVLQVASAVEQELALTDVNTLTPIEALNKLYELKKLVD